MLGRPRLVQDVIHRSARWGYATSPPSDVLRGVNDIWLTSALTAQGYDPNELARLLRPGELTRVRRGAHAPVAGEDLDREEKHRRLLWATAPQLLDGSVVSHGSAAALHRLPVWAAAIERVHAPAAEAATVSGGAWSMPTARHSTTQTSFSSTASR